ncbi:Crp/Fnr family transcriptional regulator [Desulfofalx alkaliphila]|uniref:Crp/Fnr family transcriptional regulator n=1 Tax=Desulfofalx alkaliphila TaxID=105483 RepID=UPI0004E1B9F7|nr:Crp/Fnr family transcriptional regulator [Desulfofalx alkaliphila]
MKCNHCKELTDEAGKSCIEQVPIFHGLSKQEVNEIAKIKISRQFKKGEFLFLSGDQVNNLYVIHKGKVKISRTSDEGKEQIIRVLGAGDFVGELSLFTHSRSKSNAEVMETSSICIIDGKKIKDLIYKNPGISIKILQELSERMENAENLIEQLGIHDVEQRVVDVLLSMADEEDKVTLSMSKKDLAAHIGTSQETLSRKLSYFQSKGWIKLSGQRKIDILDRHSLVNARKG